MRVCIERSTGKLIESQSGDHAAYGVLLGNAVGAGYAAEDVEEKVVTQDAFDALWLAVMPTPTYAELRQAPVIDGGYGTIPEQLEMLGEGTMTDYKAHIAAVKVRFPK